MLMHVILSQAYGPFTLSVKVNICVYSFRQGLLSPHYMLGYTPPGQTPPSHLLSACWDTVNIAGGMHPTGM